MVDLNAHEAGNGGQKPREAYSSPSLLYSENAAFSPVRCEPGDPEENPTILWPKTREEA